MLRGLLARRALTFLALGGAHGFPNRPRVDLLLGETQTDGEALGAIVERFVVCLVQFVQVIESLVEDFDQLGAAFAHLCLVADLRRFFDFLCELLRSPNESREVSTGGV